jgi:hypothetical protein
MNLSTVLLGWVLPLVFGSGLIDERHADKVMLERHGKRLIVRLAVLRPANAISCALI